MGRKPGVPNKTTREIKEAAQLYGKRAIEKLASLMDSDNPAIALKAAIAILDRGYGKPTQMIAGDPEQPFEDNTAAMDAFLRKIEDLSRRHAEEPEH